MFYMISIIIPIYNAEAYLRQCIDSIIRQTYTDWELILVDDGSSDSSASICDEYEQADKRIIALHQPNKGVSAARNAGIVRAKGKYLCFVDADDWLEENFLANFHSDEINADLFISGWIFNTYGKAYSCVKYQTRYCQSVNEIRDEFLRQNLKRNGYPWGKLFRASIIQSNKLCFNEKMSINEDHLFLLEYLLYVDSLSISSNADYQYRVFDATGMKLSGRKHSYLEYIENSESSERVMEQLKSKWNLSEGIFQDFISYFVYSRRMSAMEALILNSEKRYFCQEIKYWRLKQVQWTTKREMVISLVIKAHMPQWIKWYVLKCIYSAKTYHYKHRNAEAAIYRYISVNSTLLLQESKPLK